MVEITEIEKGSAAQKAGVQRGDILLNVNSHPVRDVLDYRFYLTERTVTLGLHRGAELLDITIRKGRYDDIGLGFATPLMDEKRRCRNKCVFCFIDQNPPGMRETIYFKDDDSRLSFLQGSYITLTNLGEDDVRRIIDMKMSPLRVSVHTTDPELRCRLLGNKNAGSTLDYLRRFAEAGLALEGQIVLCRGYNDGAALDKTMRDLRALTPSIESVSVVPAGMTRYRENLAPLTQFARDEARAVIAQVNAVGEECRAADGVRRFYCADELYLLASLPLPDEDYYDGYPQIENGVGLLASLGGEMDWELGNNFDAYAIKPRRLSLATGTAAYPFISGWMRRVEALVPGFSCDVYPVRNDFYGESITVAGLITGGDLVRQLRGRDLGERLLLPEVMLRAERDRFLDDMTTDELEAALGVPVVFCENTACAILRACADQ